MNIRIMKCNGWVYAVGEEDSFADRMEKAKKCYMCCAKICEYKDAYIKAYEAIKLLVGR